MLKVILVEAKPVYEFSNKFLGGTKSKLIGYEPLEKFQPNVEFQVELDHLYNNERPKVGEVFHGMGSFNKIVNTFVNFTRQELHVWFVRDYDSTIHMRARYHEE